MAKRCVKCQQIIGDEDLFCPYCGEKQQRICSQCGHQLDSGDVYCSYCGAKISDNEQSLDEKIKHSEEKQETSIKHIEPNSEASEKRKSKNGALGCWTYVILLISAIGIAWYHGVSPNPLNWSVESQSKAIMKGISWIFIFIVVGIISAIYKFIKKL